MYIESPKEAEGFAKNLRKKARSFAGIDAWLAPSFVHLAPVSVALKNSSIKVGAQTISTHTSGAHTGEVSAAMLKNLGVSFVIVGHSERRASGESDEVIRAELIAAIQAGLTVILCVGENERVPDGSHFQEVANQLSRALHGVEHKNRLIIAYEPVWAIGKMAEDAMQGEDLEETAIFIRKILSEQLGRETVAKIPILYGGSVEQSNAQALMKVGGVNGFLVGHASTNIDSFIEILKACRK